MPVLGVMHELLAMVVGAALSLAGHLSTDRLLRPIFRWLKEVLTVPATPFAHAGVVALRRGDQVFDLETVIECVPRPRQMVKFHNVNAGGNAVVLFRRRHAQTFLAAQGTGTPSRPALEV